MPKILIVEDDPIATHVYRTHLERAGFEVKTVADGQAALDELTLFQPEGCLIDFMLPKFNGIDLIKKMRADARLANAPLVFYTNALVPFVATQATDAGASHVFDKAKLSSGQLLEVFRHLLPKSSGPRP